MDETEKLPLKAFWEAVEERLAGFSAEELRTILRGLAQAAPPSEREAFLQRLAPAAEADAAAREAVGQPDLLADIDDLVQQLKADMEHPDEDYYEYDDEDILGPYESFTGTLSKLFRRTDQTFDAGDPALARQAYERLFAALGLEDEYGRGVRIDDLEDVDGTESRARYLRAVYETEPPERRPAALFERLYQTQAWVIHGSPMLNDLLEISPRPLPGQERFLPEWIAFLKEREEREADAWLREAVRLAEGTRGLEKLALEEGKRRPRAYLDWFEALAQEGDYRKIFDAAREALQVLPARLPIRAGVCDYLCQAAGRLNRPDALQTGRWEAFRARPTLARLVQLWEAIPDPEPRTGRMRQAARHLEKRLAKPPERTLPYGFGLDDLEEPVWVDQSTLAHACLLGSEWETAHRLAADEKPLGWSGDMNPQGLVVAFFLMALSGETPGALPANVERLWQQMANRAMFGERASAERLDMAYTELLLNDAIPEAQQETFLAWCLDVARRRVEGIVGQQRRRTYDRAALVVAACAEVLRRRGRDEQARALVAEIRDRYPRHRAFQAELDAALRR